VDDFLDELDKELGESTKNVQPIDQDVSKNVEKPTKKPMHEPTTHTPTKPTQPKKSFDKRP
jgi:hypothetical protein